MNILFDSKKLKYKRPFGCVKQDEMISIHIHIPRRCAPLFVLLCVEGENFYEEFPLQWIDLLNGYDIYQVDFQINPPGLYFYFFKIETTTTKFSLYKSGERSTNIEEGNKWQLTVYPKDFDTPSHFKGAVMYQIFPDRFYKEGTVDLKEKLKPYTIHEDMKEVPDYLPNEQGEILNCDFYGGNLKGITKKLPYLRSLGVTYLYLNPIFYAYSNHRYDTADYMRIDPMLGEEEDFRVLCKKAHELEMKILLDGVFSHTGSNSIYFDKEGIFGGGAYHNQESKFKNWFIFEEDRYLSWWGVKTLPAVNELNEDFLSYIIEDENSVISKYLKLGADGFRLDVADELPDEFIKKLVDKVKSIKKDGVVIGEVWEDASNKVSYGERKKYFTYCKLDSVMNYPFRNGILNLVKGFVTVHDFIDSVLTILENYPKPVTDCLMNSLSTHDTIRALTYFGEEDLNLPKNVQATRFITDIQKCMDQMKLAAFLQYTLPGNPCIYYGDEVGLSGFSDPFNRMFFPWEEMNEELLTFFQALGNIKTKYYALKLGTIRFIETKENILFFIRKYQNQGILCLANFSNMDYNYDSKNYKCLLSLHSEINNNRLKINPKGFFIGEIICQS